MVPHRNRQGQSAACSHTRRLTGQPNIPGAPMFPRRRSPSSILQYRHGFCCSICRYPRVCLLSSALLLYKLHSLLHSSLVVSAGALQTGAACGRKMPSCCSRHRSRFADLHNKAQYLTEYMLLQTPIPAAL